MESEYLNGEEQSSPEEIHENNDIVNEDIAEMEPFAEETAALEGDFIPEIQDSEDNDTLNEDTADTAEEESAVSEEDLIPDEKKSSRDIKGSLKNILSWVWTILLAFIIAIVINSYIIRASEVYGSSMYPTFKQGDVVFISRLPYIFSEPKHNDIVVFDSTKQHRNIVVEIRESLKYNLISQKLFKLENEDKYWIKRVIGLPGDVLYAKDGVIYRNGEPIEETYVNPEITPRYNNFTEPITVPEGYIFVMGDNRNASMDSRMIGPVPINDVLGKVVFGD